MEIEPDLSATVPAEKSKKEHSARVQRSWLSDMQAVGRPIVSVQIPQFPTTLAELLALGEDLSGGQTSSGLISLYSADKMILMLKPEAGHYRLRAWQGGDVIGVKVDWRLKAADLTDCQQQAVYTSCAMGQGITGYFEGERLDYIEWIQTHE